MTLPPAPVTRRRRAPALSPVVGIVLCGGLARRLDGDKVLRSIAGRSMVEHVVARLKPQCGALVLSANDDPARYAFLGLPVVADDVPGFAGPLAGILAGLDWAATREEKLELAVSVAADMPFLPPDLVARLADARALVGAHVAYASSGGRAHPVAALWPIAIRAQMRHHLAAGERKVAAFAARFRTATAEWAADPYDPFFNVNTPADLAVAKKLSAVMEPPDPPDR